MSVSDVIAEIVKVAAPIVLPLLTAGLAALGALLGRWIHSKTGESKVLTALASGADFVGTAVAHVIDGLRPEIEKALADDGKISQTELEQLKTRAITLILSEMPASLKTVADSLGPAFQTWLSGKVGQAIQAQVPSSPQAP